MARSLIFTLVSLVASLALASACTFPLQGCARSVCDRLDVTKWNGIAAADNSFTYEKLNSGADPGWDDSAYTPLASYFGAYNKKYNGGSFSDSKWAVRDKAPTINYFSVRNSFGVLGDTGITISECCNLCRETPNCLTYQFNPQVYRENYYIDENGDLEEKDGYDPEEDWPVVGFLDSGDCYFVKPVNNTRSRSDALQKLQKSCNSSTPTTMWDDTTKPVFYGGRCNADVKDDPHFVGARGTRFDFNGELDKSFCLITDTRVQLNTVLRGYVDPRAEKGIRSWMKELGFIWLDGQDQRHTLYLAARGGAQQERGVGFLAHLVMDGEEFPVPSQQGETVDEGLLHFSFVGTTRRGPYEVDNFKLVIEGLLDIDLTMRVAHPLLQKPDDAEIHFNMQFNSIQGSDKVHGVLGQTYRQSAAQLTKSIEYSLLARILGAPVQADGATGRGFLDGEVEDYITSSVVENDCKFSALGQ